MELALPARAGPTVLAVSLLTLSKFDIFIIFK